MCNRITFNYQRKEKKYNNLKKKKKNQIALTQHRFLKNT